MPVKFVPAQSKFSDVVANAARYVSNLRREMPNQTLPDYILLDITGDFVEREELLQGIGRVRDVAVGPDGYLYIAINQPDKVVRLVPAN